MTIQQVINNSPLSSTPNLDVNILPSAIGLNEETLTRLAAEFFSALPNQSSPSNLGQQHHGLNLDLPNANITHAPQPKDPFLALGGRVPSIVQQQHLNPQFNQQYINPTADHPERRIASSAPVIGGAHTPDPTSIGSFTPTPPINSLPNAYPHSDIANNPFDSIRFPFISPLGGVSPLAAVSPLNTETSPFYFLNEQSSQATSTTIQPINQQQAPVKNAFAFDHLHVNEDQRIRSALLDKNNKPDSPASGFYFLNDPYVDSGYSTQKKEAAQFPSSLQTYQPIDIHRIRQDFPILQERINGKPLVWFDNAATTHKPLAVIERICHFYKHENSNIHRAAHELAARASDAYEHARNVVARFIGAPKAENILFVRGTTEGINLIAKSWGKQNIQAGDEIIVSHLEHHANIVPWFQLSQETGAKLRVIPVDDTGQIKIDEFIKLLNPKTKLVSITQVSNALGTVTPTEEIIALAHAAGVRVLIDGAQSVSHMPTNVTALNADFFVFSGHKVFGPTGIGAVYAKSELLESMPVWEGGGNMIQDVTFEQIIYQPAPNKFEAGTGNIADAVGLGAALEYVESIGIHNIARYEHDLLEYGQHALSGVSGLRLIGTAKNKASVMSFVLEGYETEEVGKVLNQYGIAVRTGHHCAQPILRRFGVERTVRPSLAFYNTTEEIDLLVSVLHQLRRAKPLKASRH